MISNNEKIYKKKYTELENKLNELKAYTPNLFWNAIIRVISLRQIDLIISNQRKIDRLIEEIETFSKIYEKMNEIENRLDILQNYITNIYISDYKRRECKKELEALLEKYSFYDLSIENEKYHFLSRFISNSKDVTKKWNELFIENEKKTQLEFFKTVETNPLTESQQNAIVINENNNLVIAGAGSGKTSVIVAKIGYLVRRNFAKSEEILVLAFNKKAVEEIKERIVEKLNLEINVSTFHSFGLDIIGKANKKPMICVWATDQEELVKLIREIIKKKLEDSAFHKIFKKYFIEHSFPYKNGFDFKSKGEYYNYIKNYDLRALGGHLVKSYEELEISNFFKLKKINYIYEHPYEHETATSQRKQYQPDFYLPDYGIYIEHFGISREGKTAPFIDKDEYSNGMKWKRDIHQRYGTKLIETYSYEKSEGNLLELLEEKLKACGVEFQDVSFEEQLEIFNTKNGIIDNFTKLTIQFLNHFKSNKYTINAVLEKIGFLDFREKAFIKIFEAIFNEYEKKKNESKCIDFYDMINKAIDIVKSGLYQPKYKYILIDEFQDISSSRSSLIKSICERIDDSILTVVGDDWQSINRFAGSDVSIIKNFDKYFGVSENIFLDSTFRFDNTISKVASNFVTKNPSQIKKSIKTFKTSNFPSINIYRTSTEDEDYISIIFNFLEKKVDKKKEVLILGRFNHLKPDNLKILQYKYKDKFDIKFMSVHASKGLGADFVILIDVNRGKMGFPCEIEDDPLLNIVMAEQEQFHYSEERRLFYVALTRAKEKLFIVSDIYNESEFIKEIVNDNTENEIQFLNKKDYIAKYCPDCELGNLIEKETRKGSFYGCSNYPLCDYTEDIKKCSFCGGKLHKIVEQNIAICENKHCNQTEPLCKECNSYMSLRKKDGREFLGCSNYFKTKCTYTCSSSNVLS